MNNAHAAGALASSLARQYTSDETPSAPGTPTSDSRPGSPRAPRDASLPPRVGLAPSAAPQANLDQIDTDCLANVICAAGTVGSAPGLRSAATLAKVSRRLRNTVGETGLLPPIGQVLTQAGLVLSRASQASFEAQLPARAAALDPIAQVVLVNQLIDRFDHVPAGRARTLRFTALCRMAASLNPESAAQSMIRLADCAPLLPQDEGCTDRADQFNALLEHCLAPGTPCIELLCALANHVPRLSDANGARTGAIRLLQAQASAMAPPQGAPLRQALIGPITCVEDFQAREDLVNATFAALDDCVPPQLVADTLCDVARHLNLLTQPDECRFDQAAAQSPEASALFDRVCNRARRLPAAERARVLMTLAPLCGILPAMFQDDAIHQLRQQAAGLPALQSDALFAQLERQEAVVWPDSASNLLADRAVIAVNPSRNDIAQRLGNLPENEQDGILLTLANSLDETIPAVVRSHKFKAISCAAEFASQPVRLKVIAQLVSRLALLPVQFAGELAEKIMQASLEWPPQERLAIVQAVAAQLGHLDVTRQSQCADYLMMMSQAMTPADRATALRFQQEAFQYIEYEDGRHAFAADLHVALMHRNGSVRSAMLPAWIIKLTPFNVGSLGDEMLFSIHRETIQYETNPVAKAAILQALAEALGNFNDASRVLANVEIRQAAQSMAPHVGRPILDTLDLQRACSGTPG